MKIKGHDFTYLINKNWAYDISNGKGYFITYSKKGDIDSIKEAFDTNIKPDNEVEIIKYDIKIPIKVIKEATKIIKELCE